MQSKAANGAHKVVKRTDHDKLYGHVTVCSL